VHTPHGAHTTWCTHNTVHTRHGAHTTWCTRRNAHTPWCTHDMVHTRHGANMTWCTHHMVHTRHGAHDTVHHYDQSKCVRRQLTFTHDVVDWVRRQNVQALLTHHALLSTTSTETCQSQTDRQTDRQTETQPPLTQLPTALTSQSQTCSTDWYHGQTECHLNQFTTLVC